MTPGASAAQPRIDLLAVADLVQEGSRVLDVGCGDGELLELLRDRRQVDGRGVELSQNGVNACVARGLSVVQGDADHDLSDYPDDSFDYVILSQTIQATHNPRQVLGQMKRIGKRVVVSLPNFGHWKIRLQLLVTGRMPVTGTLAHAWYDTPNLHLCTVRDFLDLCARENLAIENALMLSGEESWTDTDPGFKATLFAEQAVFLLYRK